MIKAWTEEAWEDFEYWTRQDRKVLKRILQLLKDIDRNGYEGIGKPERLSGDLSGYWSRRIDDANRIVYRVDGNMVKIVQCGSHYRDKSPSADDLRAVCFFHALSLPVLPRAPILGELSAKLTERFNPFSFATERFTRYVSGVTPSSSSVSLYS